MVETLSRADITVAKYLLDDIIRNVEFAEIGGEAATERVPV